MLKSGEQDDPADNSAIEPGQVPQDLCNSCLDSRLRPLHVRQRRILCCRCVF
jgi:hypothetical protein